MRRRIYRISEDEFEEIAPIIKSLPEKIDETLDVDTAYQGQFGLVSENGIPLRGVVYSSNPYIMVKTPQFDDENVVISYEIGDYHFTEDDVIDGEFIVVLNQLEYRLPYHFAFRRVSETALAEIADMEAFAVYAQGHYKDAVRLFYTADFAEWIEQRTDKRTRTLYKGYRSLPGARNFDEFLVSAGVKPVSRFEADVEFMEFYGVEENQKELITLTRNTWGYIDINVSVDADFISIENMHVNSDYFLGSVLQFNFYIHSDRMHGGLNTACITFKSAEQEVRVHIAASRKTKAALELYRPSAAQQYIYTLGRMYEQYRFHEISRDDWCSRSEKMLQSLMDLEPDNRIYLLMKVQVMIVAGKHQEALFYISELKRDITDKKSTEWAYLMYLCTLIEPEERYIDQLTDEIERILVEHREDMLIFWFLLFLRKDYMDNPGRKLKDISVWINSGYNSPFLYIEALEILRQNAYMISDFSPFFMKTLGYAKKHNQITGEMARQIINNVTYEDRFDEKVLGFVRHALGLVDVKDHIEPVVAYLIKYNHFTPDVNDLYLMAIESDLRITGLYEAYVMSRDMSSSEPMPEIVLKYFQYNSLLSYDRKAGIYADIIALKEKKPELYNLYYRTIEEFALSNMRMGHIDDNMAIIYDDVLGRAIVDEGVAASMAPILYTRKIGCLYSGVSRVIVFSEQLKDRRIYPVKNDVAYVQILSDSDVIFLEHAGGYLIADENAYTISDLFDYRGYERKLYKLSPSSIEYILHRLATTGVGSFFDNHSGSTLDQSELDSVTAFLEARGVDEAYRRRYYYEILKVLKSHGREDLMTDHLLNRVDFNEVDKDTLNYIMELMITDKQVHRAYDMIAEYNALSMSKKLLVRLFGELSWEYVVSSAVNEASRSASDLFTGICGWLLESEDSLPAELVQYLNQHYVGPSDIMAKLWKMVVAENLSSRNLEERILVQMLYSSTMAPEAGEIFDSYIKHGGSQLVKEAYLTYESRLYMLGDRAEENTFNYLWTMYVRADKMNESCRLALLKRLATAESTGKEALTDEQSQALESMLALALAENKYFAWYRDLPKQLMVKFQIYDRSYVQHLDEPGQKLSIYYGPKEAEDFTGHCELIEMYPGIYVKEFVFFAEDKMDYIIVPTGDSNNLLAEGVIEPESAVGDPGLKFNRINEMDSDLAKHDTDKLIRDLVLYQGMNSVVSMIFTIK